MPSYCLSGTYIGCKIMLVEEGSADNLSVVYNVK